MNKYSTSKAIKISTPEDAGHCCLIHRQQTKSHMADDGIDAGIALAELQSALAEVTKLRLALAKSEHELNDARELIFALRGEV